MSKRIVTYIVAALLLLMPLGLGAQSIIGQKMQPRYVPVNQPFNKDGGLFANTYITLVGSGYRQFSTDYSNGPYLTVGVGKWLSPSHGVRLSGGAGYFFDNYFGKRVKMIDARASYLFNLSAYVDGYDPNRTVEVYPMAGLGYGVNWLSGEPLSRGASAHIGLELNMHALPGIDIVMEPLLEIVQDSRKLPRMDVWRGYLLALHTGVGLRVHLDPATVGADAGKDLFVFASGGVQTQNSQLVANMPFFKSLGPAATLGMGRYYSPHVAVRVSAGYSSHTWKINPDNGSPMRAKYIFARPELLLDMLGLIPGIKEDLPLSASLALGHEVGRMSKHDAHSSTYWYVGYTGAVQLKWRFYRGLAVFMEPRFLYVPYSAYAFDPLTVNRNYYDAVLSLSLGLEYRIAGRYWKNN